jgi:betaine-aldehyde dehydrogenase
MQKWVVDNSDRVVETIVSETGKTHDDAIINEIAYAAGAFGFWAKHAPRYLADEKVRSSNPVVAGRKLISRYRPLGVIGEIGPWNYPLTNSFGDCIPALAAGNAVVLKPSDTTPASSTLLAEISQEFLPPGVLNVVTGDRDTGRLLVSHKTPQMVSITGSVRAGMEVAGSAAADVKRVHLELGGKAPVIVMDDADLEAAAEAIATAGYFNAGQDCTAATRVLAGPGVHNDFVAALTEQARNTRTGMPDDEDVLYGPLNNPDQLARVSGMVDRLPDHARVEVGGGRAAVTGGEEGYFYEPTVLSGLRQDDEQIQTEIFGPVITVQQFSDEGEALRWANGVEYGLSASVWTKDHQRALRMSRDLDFGVVWINTHIPFISEMPHGGFKHSGYGKDLSMYGLEDYTRIKHVMSFLGENDG